MSKKEKILYCKNSCAIILDHYGYNRTEKKKILKKHISRYTLHLIDDDYMLDTIITSVIREMERKYSHNDFEFYAQKGRK